MSEQQSEFSIDQLVDHLKQAALCKDASAQVKSILEQTVKDPEWVGTSIPDYADDDVILFEDDSISIWHCRFLMGLSVPAHNHQMVATIAVYQGAERNVMWVSSDTGGIEQKTEILVNAGDVLQLGPKAIHSVSSAVDVDSCAIHVYLGKLTTVKRSLFDTKNGITLHYDDDNYQRLVSADGA
jgi:predicted metal-dependent enzyme (double-stranded beta helix superfamily)